VSNLDPIKLLAAIPQGLRDPLIDTYREIASNFAEHRWEPSELNGGKFCECVYWICHGLITGTYAASASKPSNMRDDCRGLEGLPATGKPGDRSLRILIPRLLPALYEIRNNRGVGHVGGDVNPNLMDATVVYSMTSWIMAELIRIFHAMTTNEAQETVDALSERKLPLVWSPSGDLKRVLDTSLSAADQTLLILHQSLAWVDEQHLFSSIEYSNLSVYRSKVLGKLHKDRMIEYERDRKRVRISPKGSAHVEGQIVAPRMGWK
jgi:hypothetical protein